MTRVEVDERPLVAPPDWMADGGEALFPEARRRQHRRRWITGLVALVVVASVARCPRVG